MVGTHATQMTVSNAKWSAGNCEVSTCSTDTQGLVSCSSGLQWGIVQTWPADHALATMMGNSGAQITAHAMQQQADTHHPLVAPAAVTVGGSPVQRHAVTA